ncbi:MAG: Crp/Fnr family transcriptional regulator [Anaerolineales bacterium]|nr:Crp/Fnr family transcriptional regulator [Anaerolineales bacterium]
MADRELIALLKKIPWFESLSQEYLERMVGIAVLRQVRAGEALFREGDKEDYLYVVLEGRIALEIFVPHKGKVRINTCEQHEVFGWSSVTPVVHQRTAGATAVIDSTVVGLDAEKLRQLCDEDHDLGYRVMRRLANVVASRLLVTRLQLLDMFADPEEMKNA